MQAKIIQVGDSLAVEIPAEAVDQMGVGEGDIVHLALTKSPDGFYLAASDPVFDEQLAKAREIMKRRDWVLRELAK